MSNHPWKLVGPWYRWQRPGVPSAGRNARPVFQKYDGPNFVVNFLADPQRSLKFVTDDLVHVVKKLPPLNPATYNAKPRRLSEMGYVPTTMRKLFLDTHKRFYLVVCELHCDLAGFPPVRRDEVCDAGFVVRRRVLRNLTRPALLQAQPIFNQLTMAREAVRELSGFDATTPLSLLKKGLAPQGEAMLSEAITASLKPQQNSVQANLVQAQTQLVEWAKAFGVALQVQGWQTLHDGIGQWVDVDETPNTITEQTFRLYPLIPDPRDAKHSGKGRTIYFGAVPTGSSDTDEFGQARLDDATQYEIRCFVKRYKHGAPRTPKCCGDAVWSLPTETYQLASHFDLTGTNHRAVSMQLPDLSALEAQAAALPPNQLAPFRMVSPPNSNLEVNADADGNITDHGTSSQICSFSIPLITIVATFVFKLFLPVVTLLFGLFFLLKLKFCIPPSISLDAGIAAELQATLQLGLDVSVDAKLEIGTDIGDHIDAKLRADLGTEMAEGLQGDFGPRAVAEMTSDIYQSGQEANAPSLTAKLQYEAHVEPEVTV